MRVDNFSSALDVHYSRLLRQISTRCGQVSFPHRAQGICSRPSVIWRHRDVQGGDRVAGMVLQDRKTIYGLQ